MFCRSQISLKSRFTAGTPFFSASSFRAGQLHRRVINKGNLSPQEIGDTSTESVVYRSRNVSALLKTRNLADKRLTEQKLNEVMGTVSPATERALDKGSVPASDELERSLQNLVDERDLELGGAEPLPNDRLKRARTATYSPELHAAATVEARRKEQLAFTHAEKPVAKEFSKLFRQLDHQADDERKISEARERLATEYGIYPTHRIDAYMLADDSHFPSWVQALPWGIRDQVKYGGLGLTEEDEAQRIRLARMPATQRVEEWKRLKAARQYELGQERRLTLSEIREARGGKRRFHWLQRKRQMRATMLRKLALRKPERFEAWPSDAVDYSQRLALVAQHVENGVETKGQWPLDRETVARAKILRKQEEAERTFLRTAEEKKMLKTSKMNGSIAESLEMLEEKTQKFKKISRRAFANRVNAVKHGDQDMYGRNTRWMQRRITKRHRPYSTVAEMALEREIRKEPLVNVKGQSMKDNQHWPDEGMARGMPSMRYGS